MREAAIVSAARTPIGRAFRGAYNQTHGATLAGHVVAHAVERAGVDPAEVEDVILGVGLPEGATGNNLGRVAALRAGLPLRVPGTTINRYCSSGLQAIATAAGRIAVDGAAVIVAGGCESISMVQGVLNVQDFTEEWILRHQPDVYMPMLQTADNVARHYGVTREAQDAYALQSQQRTAAAQAAGRFDAEIVPLPSWKYVENRADGSYREERVTLAADEGNRPDTTADGLAALKGVLGPAVDDHGRQRLTALRRCGGRRRDGRRTGGAPEPTPLGFYRGLSVVGCDPAEMGIGPVFAVPPLLERHGLSVDDIGLWELNEAFAVQTVYCRDRLGSRRPASTSTAARSQSATRMG